MHPPTPEFDAITFHYPPELLRLMVDAICKLFRSKPDVVTFFRGAGVPGYLWVPWQERVARESRSVRKYEIAHEILCKLNEREDNDALRMRREIVKRIVGVEDFSGCWPDDELPAKGLVASIRGIVHAKDTITRINQERQRERDAHQRIYDEKVAATAAKKQERESIRKDLFALFSEADAPKRGKSLEDVLNRLFQSFGILIREAFRRVEPGLGTVEQIDGAVALEGHVYLVEVKWHSEPLGVEHVAPHLVRIYGRPGTRGLIVSNSGFTGPACFQVKEALSEKVVTLCELQEIVFLLEQERDLADFIRQKAHAAEIDKEPLFRPF